MTTKFLLFGENKATEILRTPMEVSAFLLGIDFAKYTLCITNDDGGCVIPLDMMKSGNIAVLEDFLDLFVKDEDK